MPAINWLAVIVAALAMFGLGAVWYSPLLFLKPWAAAAGLEIDYQKRGNMAAIFGVSFVLTLIMAANLAFFTAPLDFGGTVAAALAAGLGWAALSLGVISLFERRPVAYMLINGGYLAVGFVLMGLILGLWK
ncbi:MAG: DUF1761 domain-containing protein [Hyphomicrobiales bacterium]|nr:MAG: DUF1761 domain-containing protein [Hyphomicrobiales bacterium]